MALPLSPKLAKMLKSLSVLASRCNVRVDTRFGEGRGREGFVEFGNSVGGISRCNKGNNNGKIIKIIIIIVCSRFPSISRMYRPEFEILES